MSQRDDSLNMFLSLRVKDEDKDNSLGDKQELVKEGGRMKGSCSLVSMLKKGQNIMGGGYLYIHCLNMSLPIFVQVAVFLLLNY